MCEYLRPVVALEWLKACCTDMITWMSSRVFDKKLALGSIWLTLLLTCAKMESIGKPDHKNLIKMNDFSLNWHTD